MKDLEAFCGNGIEIDLKELEELERRVAAKKLRQEAAAASCSQLETNFEKSLKISDEVKVPEAVERPQPSLASMFMVIMSILSILNQIHFKPTAQS